MAVIHLLSVPLKGALDMRVKTIDLDRLMDVDPAVRGYMAGFFDGEGHVSIARRGSIRTSRVDPTLTRVVYALVAGMAQNVKAPLVLFNDLFGGTLRIDTRARVGKLGKHVTYEWNINGNLQVPTFLRWLRPHLRVKATQADIAIEFARSNPNDMTEEVFLQFKERMLTARMNEAEHEQAMRLA
jgi:hypothetical protein